MRTIWPLLGLSACMWVSEQDFQDRLDLDGDGHDDYRLGGDDCNDNDAAVWDCPFPVDTGEPGTGDPGTSDPGTGDPGTDPPPTILLPWTAPTTCASADCFIDISAGYRATCTVNGMGAVDCWGEYAPMGTGIPTSGATQVATGKFFACALGAGGIVSCWGDGLDTTDMPSEPLALVDAGDTHACGLTPDGRALCWGDNSSGQTDAPPSEHFIQVDVGEDLSCGLRPDGSVRCWGNAAGHWPEEPPVRGTYLQVGESHTSGGNNCVIQRPSGATPVACWSSNNNANTDPGIGLTWPLRVASGRLHSCALLPDTEVACWGSTSYNAVISHSGRDYVRLTSGDRHSCGLLRNGDVRCWGSTPAFQGLTPL